MSSDITNSPILKADNVRVPEPTISAVHNLARDITMELKGGPAVHTGNSDTVLNQLLYSRSEYAMEEELGAGGMGKIYRARQKDLRRDVAIKQLHPHLLEVESIREGFYNEAIITGRLAHPNVVPVYGLSESERSMSMSMKLVSGCTLEDIVSPLTERHRSMAADYDVNDCIEIIIAICNPVAFAHSQRIIHRDIKPGNIMVGEFGEMLLLDWGLACSISDTPEHDLVNGVPHVSRTNGPEGTLSYMAPEMMDGNGNALGVHSDIYLLGSSLYFVLTGKPPHRHRHQKNYRNAIERDSYAPLPLTVDSELRRICERAMASSPKDRYASVRDFQQDLKNHLKHQESRQVAASAGRHFTEAQKQFSPKLTESERVTLFYELAKSLSSYRQALSLWAENTDAQQAHHDASLAAARMMYQSGEFHTALVYLKDAEGDDAEAMRVQIQEALIESTRAGRALVYVRITAIVLIGLVIASVVSAWLVYHFMEKTASQVAEETQKSLVEDGKHTLRRVVRNAATAMGFEKQTVATSLNQFAKSFEMSFAADGQLSPEMTAESAMARAEQNGFALSLPSVGSPEDVIWESATLEAIAPLVERLHRDNKDLIIRYFMGFERSGLMATYPKESAKSETPAMKETGWYKRGKTATGFHFTPPYRDSRTNRIVMSAVLPIHNANGDFIGVAGVDLHILDLLRPLKVDPKWANQCKIEIARIIDNQVEIVFSSDYENMAALADTASWVPRDRFSNLQAGIFSQMKSDLSKGAEGVVSLKHRNRKVLWGYAPLGIQDSFVLVTIDHEALTREADRIRNSIVHENTATLIYLGKVVALIFGALLMLSLLLAIPLVRRKLTEKSM
ncbi:MAG: protein kinase [Deltaproteobacteria bacterium]|nr:protein kinase [Deltaproteobacteria bacterium]